MKGLTKVDSVLAELAGIAAENSLSTEKLLPNLSRVVRRIIDCELFSVLLRIKSTPYLEVCYASGHGAPKLKNRTIRIGKGIVGTAAAKRKPIVANDVQRDRRYICAVEDVLSEMAVPLIAHRRLIGVIDFQSTRKEIFGSCERSFLLLIASKIALIIHAARLHGETATWNSKLTTLVNISHELASVLNLEELLEKIASLTSQLVPHDAFNVFVVDRETNRVSDCVNIRYKERVFPDSGTSEVGVAVRECAQSEKPLLIRDRTRHSRFRVDSGRMRAELAVPLKLRDQMVGVLDLGSEEPGTFTREHYRMLSLIAPQIAAAIENARLYESVAAHGARLTQDLAAARELQRSLLGVPSTFPGIDISARNDPAIAVSGDVYDFFRQGVDLLRIFVGDVSGKGTPAALYAALVLGSLRQLAGGGQSAATILALVNAGLIGRNPNSRYMTAALVEWRPQERSLVISSAGAPPPMFFRNGQGQRVGVEGLPLGLLPHAQYDELALSVQDGDILVLPSDGVLECCDPAGREFGYEGLARAAVAHTDSTASLIVESIFETLRNHAGNPYLQDDQTVIVLKIGKRIIESSELHAK
jgi:sigma-B regulation protein RsbU (phosphoserine phosphatase)